MVQSPAATIEAYTSGWADDDSQSPAESVWLSVILISLPCFMVIRGKSAVSVLDLWVMNTTLEKRV
jgi:hypothetical protein